jgi:hypothetical protein
VLTSRSVIVSAQFACLNWSADASVAESMSQSDDSRRTLESLGGETLISDTSRGRRHGVGGGGAAAVPETTLFLQWARDYNLLRLITCEICCTAVYEKVACSGDAIGAVLAGRLYETNAYSRSARGLRDRQAFEHIRHAGRHRSERTCEVARSVMTVGRQQEPASAMVAFSRFHPMALASAVEPPTTGSARELRARLSVSWVPAPGRMVKSRSLEKTISARRLPAGTTLSFGCMSKSIR